MVVLKHLWTLPTHRAAFRSGLLLNTNFRITTHTHTLVSISMFRGIATVHASANSSVDEELGQVLSTLI